MIITLLLLAALIHPTNCNTLNHCRRPLASPTVRYQTIGVSRQLRNASNPNHNLLYLVWRHSCLEVQYHGQSLEKALQFHLYGTCDFRRMFRFTARRTFHSCWRTSLSIWDRTPPEGTGFVHRRSLKEVYDFQWGGQSYTMLVQKDANACLHAVLVMPDAPPWIRLKNDQLGNVFRHFENESNGTYAEVPKCHCHNRSQAEVWKSRKGGPPLLRRFIVQLVMISAGLATLVYGVHRGLPVRLSE